MLEAVLRRGHTLASAAAASRGLPANDQALALAIAGETLRRLPDLDAWIDSATRQPLPDDSKARMVLRLALAQKVGLGTPDHAIVATALPLVDGGPRRLVHGVLGNLLRKPMPAMDPPRLPPAVEERWSAQWGEAVVEAARRQIAARPPLDLSFKDEASANSFANQAGGQSLAPRSVRIDSSNITALSGFKDGGWWVQDLAASLPARLIPAGVKMVIDLCAAPGGKTMQLAAAGHQVISVDSSADRLKRLRVNLDRTHLNAQLVTADAREFKPDQAPGAILLDVPCSATGTFRRHPEVLYRARPAIIEQMAELQRQLLDHSAGLLEPGSTLIYATCSLERAEGEELIASFLAANPDFAINPPKPGELPDFAAAAPEGWVRILPGTLEAEGGLDGFFAVRLQRNPDSDS